MFRGIDLRGRAAPGVRENIAMRDAVGMLDRLAARVVGAEADERGVREELWRLCYVGTIEHLLVCISSMVWREETPEE